MEYIQIPAPDFSFADIAKEHSKTVIESCLVPRYRQYYVMGFKLEEFELKLETAIYRLHNDEDRLVCISELLLYLDEQIRYGNTVLKENEYPKYVSGINRIKYFLYGIAKTTSGYSFDKNAFSTDEIIDLESKIDNILSKLNELKAGQEVIYNEFEDVKSQIKGDFESLKSDPPLGKNVSLK